MSMKKWLINVPLFFVIGMILTACSVSNPFIQNVPVTKNKNGATFITGQGKSVAVAPVKESSEPISGHLSSSMDELDKSKMWHALDNPIGKSSQWVNGKTGVEYTVVPTKKVSINDNQFCRHYTTTAKKSGRSKQISGVACVSSDGNWHSVNVNE